MDGAEWGATLADIADAAKVICGTRVARGAQRLAVLLGCLDDVGEDGRRRWNLIVREVSAGDGEKGQIEN